VEFLGFGGYHVLSKVIIQGLKLDATESCRANVRKSFYLGIIDTNRLYATRYEY